jgi:hypothetical protein
LTHALDELPDGVSMNSASTSHITVYCPTLVDIGRNRQLLPYPCFQLTVQAGKALSQTEKQPPQPTQLELPDWLGNDPAALEALEAAFQAHKLILHVKEQAGAADTSAVVRNDIGFRDTNFFDAKGRTDNFDKLLQDQLTCLNKVRHFLFDIWAPG